MAPLKKEINDFCEYSTVDVLPEDFPLTLIVSLARVRSSALHHREISVYKHTSAIMGDEHYDEHIKLYLNTGCLPMLLFP